jgi:flagellar motility protein MotE (MotC chaperone)
MGQQKVAQLWAEMGVDPLLKIIADWKNEDLAPILSKMDNEKVTKLLEAMAEKDAKRASMLTKAVQSQASKVDPETVAAG